MNVFELLIFLLLCTGLGYLGRIFSPHWGWLAGAIPAVAVFGIMFVATIRAGLRSKR
jgi:hypothetical protein